MAATTRTITDTIYKMDGTPWAGATVRINRVDRPMLDTDGTIGDSVATGTTDENGDVTLTVAVPPSGAGRYLLTRPVETGRPVDVTYFYLASGDPISVGEILAASASALTEDAVLTLLSSYLSKANNLSDLASAATARANLGLGTAATAATGDFEAAGAVAAHTGDSSAAHAASAISVTPAGELTSTDVQAALAEIQGDIDGMGGGDVDDLTTTTGSSTDMLRVAAAGGLEYRTTAQVLGDIGAAPTASPTFTGTVTLPTTVASVIKPASDSTTALQLANAAGTSVVTVDTTNSKLKIKEIEIWTGGITENIGIAAGTSLRSGSTGTRNIAIGNAALGNLTSGGSNVTIGFFAGIAITSGSSNTAIGASAQRNGNPSGTIAIGVDAANGNTGNDCVIIGNLVGKTNTTNSKFLLGNNATLSLLDGIMSTTVAASSLKINGLTGLGTNATPTAYADIAASTTAAASLRIRSGTAPTTPNAGDIWFDGTNLKMHDGTTTRTISWT